MAKVFSFDPAQREFKVEDSLQPSSSKDALRRAYFLIKSLNCRHRMMILQTLESYSNEQCINFPEGEKLNSAAKEISTISLKLMASTHDVDRSPWFVDWLFSAMQFADALEPEPAAQFVIKEFGAYEVRTAAALLAKDVCDRMNIDSLDLVANMAQKILGNTGFRNEILEFALTQPLERLQEHLHLLCA